MNIYILGEGFVVSEKNIATPTTKTSMVHIDGKDYKVVSIFEGTETASKLLYDMAISRILNEKTPMGC